MQVCQARSRLQLQILIESQWNLNTFGIQECLSPSKILIESQWNLNSNQVFFWLRLLFHINRITVEFKYGIRLCSSCLMLILIESQWNLNVLSLAFLHLHDSHINRITVEFKFRCRCHVLYEQS